MTEEPKLRINDREELIYMLAEAAAIEHNVMCSYFYGIWSMKRGERDGLSPEHAKIVNGWRNAFIDIAIEEMTHLTLVENLASAIGGAPHFSRPNFPIPFGYHPSGIDLELHGFSMALVDHGIFLERPEGIALDDSSDFVHPKDYHRTSPSDGIMPSAQDFETIGHLYRGIRHGFEALAEKLGEKELFCGDPADQIGPAEAPLPGLSVVTNLESAREAIETIVEQGEGAPEHSDGSHYARLVALKEQYQQILNDDPVFAPAFPVARNPVAHEPMNADNRVWVNHPVAVPVLDLANSLYAHMLRCLVQGFGRDPEEEHDHKRLFITLARELMSVLTRVGGHLATLPANPDHPGVNAGVTFTMLRDVARLPSGAGEMRFMTERLLEMADQAARIFPRGHELDSICDALVGMAGKLHVPGAEPPKPKHVAHDDRPAPLPEESEGHTIGQNENEDMVLYFDTQRCIHSRFCVLGAPKVFLSGVTGQWLYPDEMATANLRGVCHNCPSGAIHYTPKGDVPPEPAPEVNIVNIRENGPYAFRAPLVIDGKDDGFRATLCRCGASKNKPWCDGSHVKIGFRASGEPDTRHSEPLAVRNGPLHINPQ